MTPETGTPGTGTPGTGTPATVTLTPGTGTPPTMTLTPGTGTPGTATPTATGPANQVLAEAEVVTELPFGSYISTVGASTEPNEADSSCAESSASVWYRFTASEAMTVRFYTQGSGFDTVLSIWSGTEHPLTELACDDDASELVDWSNLQRAFTAGQSVYIRVGGKLGASGNLVFVATEVTAGRWLGPARTPAWSLDGGGPSRAPGRRLFRPG
jgi:hypothetical protein